MSLLELHSDYDRDGRISRSTSEYAARGRAPGAILVANLDADGRSLPSSVAPRRPVTLDFTRDPKSSGDSDLLGFRLRLAGPIPAGHAFALRLSGGLAGRARFVSNRRVQGVQSGGALAGMTAITPSAAFAIELESGALAGTPSGQAVSLSTQRASFPAVDVGRLTVELMQQDAGQVVSRLDQGRVQLAPFLLIDNTAPAVRMWICVSEPSGRVAYRAPQFARGATGVQEDPFIDLEGVDPNDPLGGLPEEDEGAAAGSGRRTGSRAPRAVPATQPENHPSIEDVRAALRGTPVALQLIPLSVNNGDCWIQDQLQFGFCHGPRGVMHVALHLPRQQSNAGSSQLTANLSGFATGHLPSTDVGVCDDFWNRVVGLRNGQGNPVRVSFGRTFPILRVLGQTTALFSFAREQLREFATRPVTVPAMPSTWLSARRGLEQLVDQAVREIGRARSASSSQDFRALTQTVLDMLDERLRFVQRTTRLARPNVELTVDDSALGGSTATAYRIPQGSIDDLFFKLHQLHSSQNYGGNIEVGPPTTGAPFGKLVVGNRTRGRETSMDVELITFLESQHVQPLVEIDTDWLEVGHIDEVATFVPRGRNGHAILRASSALAMDILYAAEQRYRFGLPSAHDHPIPFDGIHGLLRRTMELGQSPVTHMLRGREWLHHHPANAMSVHLPPLVYQRLAAANSRAGLTSHNIPLTLGPGADRRYPASLSVWEFLFYEFGARSNERELFSAGDMPHHRVPSDLGVIDTRSTNYFIEHQFLEPAHGVLESAFPGIDVFCLPALFDAVERAADLGVRQQTSAFTPNLVNLQVIGDRLLIPRPSGPRMRAAEALAVVRRVAEDRVRSRLTRQLIRSRRLTGVEIWLEPPISLRRLAQWFRDAFPRTSLAQITRAINNANPGDFDSRGELKSGWRKIRIPEPTVDLFELYTEAVAALLGLSIHWVDSWYYHIRLGEIHCGTNVLRRPRVSSSNAWWRRFPVSAP